MAEAASSANEFGAAAGAPPALGKDEIKAIAKQMMAVNPPNEATYWHNQRTTARWLASTLFMGKQWGIYDYTQHLEQVASLQTSELLKTIAWLHDLIEDIPGWTLDDLREIGFHENVVQAVDALTKREAQHEKYFEAVCRCGLNEHAPKVKKADNMVNSQLIEYHRFPTQKQHNRADKYWISYHYLDDVDTGRTPRGTPVLQWALENETRLLNPSGDADVMPEDRERFYDLLIRETDAETRLRVEADRQAKKAMAAAAAVSASATAQSGAPRLNGH